MNSIRQWPKKLSSARVMFRVLSLALLPLGIGLLWFDGIIQPYVQNNFSYSADIITTDNYYDVANKRYAGDRYASGKFFYQLTQHGNGVSTVQNTIDLSTVGAGKLATITTKHGVSNRYGTYAMDDSQNSPQYMFAPRNLAKGQDFTYRHVTYDAPANMRYVGEETLFGLTTYHYETRYENASILEAKNVPVTGASATQGIAYTPHLQLWVEPTSGWLVKFQDNTAMNYFDRRTGAITTPFNRYATHYTDSSVAQQAAYAQSLKNRLIFTHQIAPGILFIIFWSVVLIYAIRRLTSATTAVRMCIGLAIIIIGVAVAGWLFKTTPLTTFFTGTVGINPLTIVCCMLIVLCTLMIHRGAPRTIVAILGGSAVAIASIGVLNTLDILTLQPDPVMLYGENTPGANVTIPSRMPLYDSFTLLVLALAILGSSRRLATGRRFAKFAAGIAITLGYAGLVTQFFQVDQQFSVAPLYSLSATAAILFIACGTLLLLVLRNLQGQPSHVRQLLKSLVRPALVTLPIILISIAAQVQENNIKQQLNTAFSNTTAEIQSTLTGTLKKYTTMLSGAQALFAASKEVEAQEWHTYIQAFDLAKQYPGVQNVGFVHSTADNKAAPVTYIEPQTTTNRQLLGYNFLADATRTEAMQRLVESGHATTTRKIEFSHSSTTDQTGFILFMPVYAHDAPVGTVAERKTELEGYVFATIDLQTMVNSVLSTYHTPVDLTIYDGPHAQNNNLLFDSWGASRPAATYAARLSKTATIDAIDRSWTINYTARQEFRLNDVKERSPALLLIVGTLLYCIVLGLAYGTFVYYLTVRRTSKQKIAGK